MTPRCHISEPEGVNKAEFTDADMDSWLPEAMGVRPIGEKKLRKTVRKVTSETDKRKN